MKVLEVYIIGTRAKECEAAQITILDNKAFWNTFYSYSATKLQQFSELATTMFQ